MEIGHLSSWPPVPTGKEKDPDRYEGTFQGCEYVPRTPQHEAHLLVYIRRQGMNCTAVYWHASDVILRRLEASLKGKAGILLEETRHVRLLEL